LTNISDGGTTTIVSYEYDSAGRRTKRTLQNNTFTVLEYGNGSQLTNIWHRQISGGSFDDDSLLAAASLELGI
jgi:YD repeat-containing protein